MGSVDQLCWHATLPDLLSTASGDKTVRIWDVRAGKCSTTINTKGENINITWSPDGNTIAVGNKEDLVTFIDTRTHKIRAEEQFNFEVNEIAWNNTSDLFFLTNGQGCIHVLSYPSLELQHMLKAHPGTCICIEFDPTGKYFATGSADALVSLWDANELACLVSWINQCSLKLKLTKHNFISAHILSAWLASSNDIVQSRWTAVGISQWRFTHWHWRYGDGRKSGRYLSWRSYIHSRLASKTIPTRVRMRRQRQQRSPERCRQFTCLGIFRLNTAKPANIY